MNLIKKLCLGITAACLSLTAMAVMADEVEAAQTVKCEANGADTEDDTAAIQSALNKAITSSDAIVIELPAGKYYVSRTLTIYSNTTLKLHDNAEIIRTDESITLLKTDQDYEKGGYDQFKNIVIEGGIWNGNVQDSTVTSPLMYFVHGTNFTMKNCTIESVCSKHMVIVAGVNGATIDGVTFKDFILYTGEDELDEYYSADGETGELDIEGALRTMEALQLDCISEDGASEGGAYPCDGTTNKNIVVQN